MPQPKKQYIIRKYISARSASEALKIEGKYKADDCWLDEDWKKSQPAPDSHIGFNVKKK
jgi:hypothetical protein